ncbi:hypothetical protein [Fimbriimonas ginsengisoli]|uniref:Uncharacterized protein n=1 Tax=Fimbriimonas ginsengisoli Gsoil 348 TaxID=661478 RepID=A0A068NY56_FIMGI|nr:hypothetical protein [Fimbriimonas ginsengisoli]AIE86659.1 hypothetical protein OP10G_3291 [Fimbriimonas ginsengisoli Gsoil 348]
MHEKWRDEKFRALFDLSDPNNANPCELVPEFQVGWERNGDRVFLTAHLKSRLFVLGETVVDDRRVFSFNILSVAGMEVVGKVVCRP